MSQSLTYALIALLCLLPAVFVQRREAASLDAAHWAALVLAVLGSGVWALGHITGQWQAGLSSALWVSIAVTLSLFTMLAWSVAHAWRLTQLLAPYMLALGVLGLFAPDAAQAPLDGPVDAWVALHILVSVVTYGLVTIAAVSALAAFLQDRALKTKRPTQFTHTLPSVADCESIAAKLLGWGEGILGLGLVTGMAAQYRETGQLLAFDHKTVLSVLAFVVIGTLLFVQHKTGLRGRKAARLGLLAYLLLTLGYLGVKVVTGMILI